jgi:hypothetical protein
MRTLFRRALGCALLMLLITSGRSAHAAVAVFSTAPGATESGGNPVSATATFTTLANEVQVTLTNTLANPTTVAQALSDLGFTLSTGQTLADASIKSSSGTERTIASNGTFVDGASVATGWSLDSSGSPIRLHLLGTPTAPTHTIIGPPDGSNVYSAANSSIAGNGPHNPFLAGTVTFDLTVNGVTAATTVTSAVFSFGTDEGNNVPGVPEPASIIMLGLGAAGMCGYGWKKRRQVTAN